MPWSRSHFKRSRRKLAAAMQIKFPEYCFRNSYATYALPFRSLGEVAKAMGDAEATVWNYSKSLHQQPRLTGSTDEFPDAS